MRANNILLPLSSFFFFFFLFPTLTTSINTLTSSQSLTKDQTLLSPSSIFELGFFNPSDSKWYLGIWYQNIPDKTVVWVANRDSPLSNSSALLQIGPDGKNIVLLDQSGALKWSSNNTKSVANPSIQLLDSGNLVLTDLNENSEDYLWQSFDLPTDTLLPDMKLGWDLNSGTDRVIQSWKNRDDPSSGDFSFNLDFHGFPEIFLLSKQNRVYRSGPWNGIRFSGVPEMAPLDGLSFTFVTNQDEVYYSFSISKKSLISRLVVNSSGALERYTWIPTSRTWNKFWYAPKDQCDNYIECGPYGICDTNFYPVCKCVQGFQPKNVQAWNLRDGSGGCVRKTELDCSDDGFVEMDNMKVPESGGAVVVDKSMSVGECREVCLRNCSCTAFSDWNISNGGSGCVLWFGELLDIRVYEQGGQRLFIRLAASDLGGVSSKNSKRVLVIIVITVCIAILLSITTICILWKRKTLQALRNGNKDQNGPRERSQDLLINPAVISSKRDFSGEKCSEDELELPLFDFAAIVLATENFSEENRLGQGGFGIVYKGRLPEGRDIAVKRLSKNSGQGIEEFKNEVKLIARLQHRNLVRLLGCCIEMEEKMLIYEYMENRSLDSVLFSKTRKTLLDWPCRFNIICGIARGLLYLHQDSRFRIIHRDLKASNILLDRDMDPKISDFGMARIFGTDQTEANTVKVVGTYGYMSPEYAMDGVFSVKSDVFSFGVLVQEIISGNKNRGFYYANNELNLLGYAWNLWREEKGLELVDSSMADSWSPSGVLRCIQVSLLCVQERAEDRPTMSSVVLMLSSETAIMPQPKNPGFCLGRSVGETDSSSSKQEETFTVNQVTVTVLDAR